MRRPVLRVAAAAAALTALAACGGDAARPSARGTGTGTDVTADGQTTAPARPDAGAKATVPSAAAVPGADQPGAQASTAPSAGGVKPTAPASAAAPPSGQPQPQRATAAELPIDAKVSPACVAPGGAVTLAVTTMPRASLGYVAVYADGKSGATAPFGHGYGGNEAGQTDAAGMWKSTWTVRADAPRGKGHITLVVAHSGKSREINIPFSVGVREADGCGS